jgi:hypothetical protein
MIWASFAQFALVLLQFHGQIAIEMQEKVQDVGVCG